MAAQQGLQFGLTAAEGDEGFQCRTGGADGEDFLAEARAGGRIQHVALTEGGKGIGGGLNDGGAIGRPLV